MAIYKHLRSSTANKRPTTSIADGQLAINTNTASPGLFFKDSAGTGIVKVGPVHVGTTAPNVSPAAGGSSGNYTGEQWLDTSVSPNQMKVWNGSAWVGIVADELPVSKLQDGIAGQIVQTDSAGTGVEWSSTTNLPIGGAGAPAYSFQSDSNTGIYSPGADQVAISTAGTGRVFVDANGNVGIGGAASANGLLRLNAASGLNSNLIFSENNTDRYVFGKITGDDALRLYDLVAGSERLRITSDGKVGIGTSAPQAPLDVYAAGSGIKTILNIKPAVATIGDGGAITFSNLDPASYQLAKIAGVFEGGTFAGSLRFYTNTSNEGASPSERLRITSDGNVGIGSTSDPGAYGSKLWVDHTADTGIAINTTGSTSRTQLVFRNSNVNGEARIYNGTGGPLTIYKNSSEEAVRLDSSGRLLVGTSSASTGNNTIYARVQVVGNSAVSPGGGIINIGRNEAATSITTGEGLGTLVFGDSGAGEYAWITCEADGNAGSGDYPGRLVFATTADGAATPTERMRIKNDGTINFSNVATYADNAAATAGGLAVGDVYRTATGQLMIRY